MDDHDDLTIPDWLDVRKTGRKPDPLPKHLSARVKNPNRIVWPKKEIERAMRQRAKAKKDKAASLKGCTFVNRKGQ